MENWQKYLYIGLGAAGVFLLALILVVWLIRRRGPPPRSDVLLEDVMNGQKQSLGVTSVVSSFLRNYPGYMDYEKNLAAAEDPEAFKREFQKNANKAIKASNWLYRDDEKNLAKLNVYRKVHSR